MTITELALSTELEFSFSSRENYLEFVRTWKESYKQLSKDIRARKIALKNLQRSYTDETVTAFNKTKATMKVVDLSPWLKNDPIAKYRGVLTLSQLATVMLIIRAKAKVVSGIQRDAARAAKVS